MTAAVKSERYSSEDRKRFLDLWQNSGLSQTEFCRQQGIPTYLFYSWKHKLDSQKLKLLPVIADELPVKNPLPPLKLTFPSGISCQFAGHCDIKFVIQLIRGYEQCN